MVQTLSWWTHCLPWWGHTPALSSLSPWWLLRYSCPHCDLYNLVTCPEVGGLLLSVPEGVLQPEAGQDPDAGHCSLHPRPVPGHTAVLRNISSLFCLSNKRKFSLKNFISVRSDFYLFVWFGAYGSLNRVQLRSIICPAATKGSCLSSLIIHLKKMTLSKLARLDYSKNFIDDNPLPWAFNLWLLLTPASTHCAACHLTRTEIYGLSSSSCHPYLQAPISCTTQSSSDLSVQATPLSLLINKNFSSLLCFVLSYNCQPPRPQLAQLLTQSCLSSSQDPIIWRNYKPSIWTSFNFFQAWIVNVVSGSFQPSSSDWWLIFADCLLWEEKLHRIHIFRR